MREVRKPQKPLNRSADSAKRERLFKRIVAPVLCASTLLLVIVYLVSLAFDGFGSFTITVKDYGDRKYSLALCENDVFKNSSSRLTSAAANEVDNIAASNLPEDINDVDGSHNGDNYLAYTFYLKNTGSETCAYRYSIVISRATLGIDAAARIRVYFNERYYTVSTNSYYYSNDYTDYAKPKTSGNGEPEIDPVDRKMTNFLNNDVVVEEVVNGFRPGDISKITVVIWLEGNDPDCTDDVLGGQFKTDMVFEICDAAETAV